MSEQQNCLGVAWLTEREPAASFREDPNRPLQGYFMLSGSDEGLRVSVQLDNCRRLSPRQPGNSHVYEAVILVSGEEVDAGGFNATAAGTSSATFLIPDCTPSGAVTTRVDLIAHGGARTAILEGPVVWLQPPIEADQRVWSQAPANEPAPEEHGALRPVAGGSETAAPEGAILEQAPEGAVQEQAPEGAVQEQAPEPAPEAAPQGAADNPLAPDRHASLRHALLGMVQQFEPVAGDGAFGTAPMVQADGPAPMVQADGPEPAPQSGDTQPTRHLFERIHHSAFRANGYALVDRAAGTVEVTVRGLPSPSLLGGTLIAYKIWLASERNRSYLPVGVCAKLFADTYRLSAHGMPLNRYESLLVTAEEQPNGGFPVGPKVLMAAL